MDVIYESFLISAVLANEIKIKDFWSNKYKYLTHEWTHAPRKWIDPQKEANATKIAIESGQKTFQQVAAENGSDWKEQIKDLAEAVSYANEVGIDLAAILYGSKKEMKIEEEKEE